jgi:GMP synthase (glutamine-hydrolysing)
MRIHCLQHVPYEGLGLITEWARIKQHALSTTHFYKEETLPGSEDFDALVVMGGPMGAGDDGRYPWLTSEKRFIEQAIEENKPILGICLGAQLLALVLGAGVFPNLHKEIGWFPVTFTDEARQSSIVAPPCRQLTVFHWHGDTFDLPRGAVRIAESEACSNQAFVCGPKVLGLQFHLEFTRAGIRELIRNCAEDLTEGSYIQSPTEMLAGSKRFKAANAALNRILDRIYG